jgi:hypothetical protein
MTIYREMQIEAQYPNGYSWGPENDGQTIGSSCKTIEEAKEEIDRYHMDNVTVALTLTFEELLAVQLALGIAYKKAPYTYLKKASDKVNQALEDVQKDIEFERQYTVND